MERKCQFLLDITLSILLLIHEIFMYSFNPASSLCLWKTSRIKHTKPDHSRSVPLMPKPTSLYCHREFIIYILNTGTKQPLISVLLDRPKFILFPTGVHFPTEHHQVAFWSRGCIGPLKTAKILSVSSPSLAC